MFFKNVSAYNFFSGKFQETFRVDSGFVPMKNPFCDDPHSGCGTDPVYGKLAGQGNHSLAVADSFLVSLEGAYS